MFVSFVNVCAEPVRPFSDVIPDGGIATHDADVPSVERNLPAFVACAGSRFVSAAVAVDAPVPPRPIAS